MEFAQIYVLPILLLKNVRKVYNTIEPNIINIFVNHVLFQVYLYCILYNIKEDFSFFYLHASYAINQMYSPREVRKYNISTAWCNNMEKSTYKTKMPHL